MTGGECWAVRTASHFPGSALRWFQSEDEARKSLLEPWDSSTDPPESWRLHNEGATELVSPHRLPGTTGTRSLQTSPTHTSSTSTLSRSPGPARQRRLFARTESAPVHRNLFSHSEKPSSLPVLGKRRSPPRSVSPGLPAVSKLRLSQSSDSQHVTSSQDGTKTQEEDGPIKLSDEQNDILHRVLAKQNLFFTGSAGTGKSVLLREIIEALGKAGRSVAVTAPTGIAGINIGGTTLHSFAGIGLGKENCVFLVEKIIKNNSAVGRWKGTDTLIIDEISMVDGKLFDKLEHIARYIRGTWKVIGTEELPNKEEKEIYEFNPREEPFGGMQLVISGDFFQLPPVPDKIGHVKIPATYAFDADTWEECVPNCYMLTQVFRQSDPAFVNMLNKMRVGEFEPDTVAQFKRLSRPLYYDDGLEPTQLFPMKDDVIAANKERLKQLPGLTHGYRSIDTPGWKDKNERYSEKEMNGFLSRLVAPAYLPLRVGAQVMLIQNMTIEDDKLVNGSLGLVKGFMSPEAARQGARSKILKIASVNVSKSLRAAPFFWASFSEDSTTATARTDVCVCEDETCTCGSRMTYESNIHKMALWPVVEFSKEGRWVVAPATFTVTNVFGDLEAQRIQIPLILAWALSIHKSQGQTLERVKIDLSGTFETGQAYVALSRARSLQTLQVLNFQPWLVKADPKVIEWYKLLRVHGTNGPANNDEDPDASATE